MNKTIDCRRRLIVIVTTKKNKKRRNHNEFFLHIIYTSKYISQTKQTRQNAKRNAHHNTLANTLQHDTTKTSNPFTASWSDTKTSENIPLSVCLSLFPRSPSSTFSLSLSPYTCSSPQPPVTPIPTPADHSRCATPDPYHPSTPAHRLSLPPHLFLPRPPSPPGHPPAGTMTHRRRRCRRPRPPLHFPSPSRRSLCR